IGGLIARLWAAGSVGSSDRSLYGRIASALAPPLATAVSSSGYLIDVRREQGPNRVRSRRMRRRSPWTPCAGESAFLILCGLPPIGGGGRMTRGVQHLRLAWKSLRSRQAYAVLVVAILGIGIGANTAIFGLVDAVLIRSLPYSDPDSLVVVFADGRGRNLNP